MNSNRFYILDQISNQEPKNLHSNLQDVMITYGTRSFVWSMNYYEECVKMFLCCFVLWREMLNYWHFVIFPIELINKYCWTSQFYQLLSIVVVSLLYIFCIMDRDKYMWVNMITWHLIIIKVSLSWTKLLLIIHTREIYFR